MRNSYCHLGALTALFFFGLPLCAETIIVDSDDDFRFGTAAACILRDAIEAANDDQATGGCPAGSGADRIEFMPDVNYIVVVEDLPDITEDLTIVGPGRDQLLIDGDDQYSLLRFLENTAGEVRGLTLYQGFRDFSGPCLFAEGTDLLVEDVLVDSCSSSSFGHPAVHLRGDAGSTFTFRRTTLRNNSAPSTAGLGATDGSFVGEDLLIDGNRSTSGGGAGMSFGGSVHATLRRSTLTRNQGTDSVAIQVISASATAVVEHCTITDNESTSSATTGLRGGAIRNDGTMSLFNTIVAGNLHSNSATPWPDIAPDREPITSLGFNFIGNNRDVESQFPQSNSSDDIVGTAASPESPGLLALADNGGPTWTALPGANSPVIDAGSCPSESADQRGYHNRESGLRSVDDQTTPGAVDDGCDIGAIEVGALEPTLFDDGFETGDSSAWI